METESAATVAMTCCEYTVSTGKASTKQVFVVLLWHLCLPDLGLIMLGNMMQKYMPETRVARCWCWRLLVPHSADNLSLGWYTCSTFGPVRLLGMGPHGPFKSMIGTSVRVRKWWIPEFEMFEIQKRSWLRQHMWLNSKVQVQRNAKPLILRRSCGISLSDYPSLRGVMSRSSSHNNFGMFRGNFSSRFKSVKIRWTCPARCDAMQSTEKAQQQSSNHGFWPMNVWPYASWRFRGQEMWFSQEECAFLLYLYKYY